MKLILTKETLNNDPHLWNAAKCSEMMGWMVSVEELYALPDEELFALYQEIEICRAYSTDKALAWKIHKGLV